MRTWTIALFVLVCLPMAVGAQEATVAPPLETIHRGQVVSDAGDPVPGVHVSLRARPDVRAALTDALGTFSLALPPGRQHQLVVRKAGFDATLIAAPAPDDVVTVLLRRRAIIAGRITDDAGEPVPGVDVTARDTRGSTFSSTVSDDRGTFRLSVPANTPLTIAADTLGSPLDDSGQGVLANAMVAQRVGGLVVRTARPARHTLYFPGVATTEAATVLQMAPGEERSTVDIAIPTELTLRQPSRGLDAIPILAGLSTTGDGAGTIQGLVVDASNRPLSNTLVVLARERVASTIRMARTDAAGAFEFRDVGAGTHTLIASRPGYSSDTARPDVVSDSPLPVSVTLRATPLSALSGRIVDEFGEPIQGARVRAMLVRDRGSRRHLVPVEGVEVASDERGEYRLFGLEPGAYLVTASTATSGAYELLGYLRAYAPVVGADRLSTIRVGPGQEISSLDVQLPRGPTYRVTGQVFRASGGPGVSGSLQLWPSQRPGLSPGVPIDARVDATGRFEFQNVPDGAYVIQVRQRRQSPMTEGEFGALPVVVNGANVSGLVVTSSPGSTIAGAVVFDTPDTAGQPSRADVEISPIPADPDLAPADNWATAGVTSDWMFAIAGVTGPRRLQATRLPRGWALKEIRAGGVDITDQMISFGTVSQSLGDVEVVLTNRPASLTGRLVDARGLGRAGLRVVAFAPTQDAWYRGSRYLREAQTSRDGTFTIVGLPAGGYFVAVLPGAARDDPSWWQDTNVLESLMSSATFVIINDAQRTTVQLQP